MQQDAAQGRLGMAVLLQQGLAAWIEQWAEIPAPPPRLPTDAPTASPLRENIRADVINVLATMALGHLQEVHA